MAKNDLNRILKTSMLINIILSAAVIVLAFVLVYQSLGTKGYSATTTIIPSTATNTSNAALGHVNTTAGIDQQFNASQLAAINDAPLSYYEFAGEKLLNGTLTNQVGEGAPIPANAFIVNGKPSVIYIGAISCVYCGENRWAMALALAKFGNFSQLFQGYSSYGDYDLPTIYWNDDNYTTPAGVGYGNYYNSKYINFISADYESPIVEGFEVGPLSFFIQNAPNSTYASALSFMNSTGKFEGTPFTLWGNSLVPGADAVVLGNSTPTTGQAFPLQLMTHEQVISQLASFNDQFAWSEFAAADIYIAQVCPSINDTAPVCALPAIKSIGTQLGLAS